MAVPLRTAVAKGVATKIGDLCVTTSSGKTLALKGVLYGHNLISVRKLAKDGYHQGNQLYADAYQFLVKIDTRKSKMSTNHDFLRILASI